MPFATRIRLPRGRAAVFPDRCIGCGAEHPGATDRVTSFPSESWDMLLRVLGRRGPSVEVPACAGCVEWLRDQRATRIAASAVTAAAGIGVLIYLIVATRGQVSRWTYYEGCLACALPLLLWEYFRPLPFLFTAHADEVDYHFRDPEYAAEFQALNAGDP